MKKQQLLDLADHIENMDPARFYMGHWGFHPDGEPVEVFSGTAEHFDELLKTGHTCGTSCCIAGEDFLRSGQTAKPSNFVGWFARRHAISYSWAHVLLVGEWAPEYEEERDNKLAACAIRALVDAIETEPGQSPERWAEEFREQALDDLAGAC